MARRLARPAVFAIVACVLGAAAAVSGGPATPSSDNPTRSHLDARLMARPPEPPQVLPAGAASEVPPYPLVSRQGYYEESRVGGLYAGLEVAKRRTAAPVPFDLTYLPPYTRRGNGPCATVAVRPSALFDRPGGDRLARVLMTEPNAVLHVMQQFVGLQELSLPRPSEVDMVLVRVHVDIQREIGSEHGTFTAGCFNGAVLRTRGCGHWEAGLRDLRPALPVEHHRGHTYRVVSVDLREYFPKQADPVLRLALYLAPDRKTLVVDDVDTVKALLDRVTDGGPVPTPAGWESVSRGVLAVSLDNRDKVWTKFLPGADGPRLPKGGDWEWDLLDDLDEVLVGLEMRPTTRFRLTAAGRDPFAGKRLVWNARRLLALAEAHLAEQTGPPADVVRAMWKKGTFTPTRLGFEITADAGEDLLGRLLDRLTPPEPDRRRFEPHPVPWRTGGF